jgi:7,8-dihydropterin-6-yl-methyl-4-(beta-D-ribofuranosyl)aminobenzene 5'-phosphate synthase
MTILRSFASDRIGAAHLPSSVEISKHEPPYNENHMRLRLIFLLCGITSGAAAQQLKLTIVSDSTSIRPDLPAESGFSVLADYRGHRVLFNSGSKLHSSLARLQILGIDPGSIERTVESHEYPDPDGMARFMPMGLYYFIEGFKPGVSATPGQIAPGIYTTGHVYGSPPEQALLIETSKGLVMLAACAHPGAATMVETAEKQRGKHSIRLLLGGLHLYDQDAAHIRPIVGQLRKLNVESIVPTYCSGDLARRLFREAYGKFYSTGGAGQQFVLD